jgi:hypothetical protein
MPNKWPEHIPIEYKDLAERMRIARGKHASKNKKVQPWQKNKPKKDKGEK